MVTKKKSASEKFRNLDFIKAASDYKKNTATIALDVANIALILLVVYIFSTALAQPLLNQSNWLSSTGADVKSYVESDSAFSQEKSNLVNTFSNGATWFVAELIGIILLLLLLILLVSSLIQAYIWSILKEMKFSKKIFLKTLWIMLIMHAVFIPVACIFFLGDNIFFTLFVLAIYLIFMAWCNNVVMSVMKEDKGVLDTIGEGIGLSIKKLGSYLPNMLVLSAIALLIGWLLGRAMQTIIEPYIVLYIILFIALSWSKVLFYTITERITN